MRHPNVRNADEVEAREMIKGRHNMRLRQLGKPAGSRALGATLTEVAPGAVSFPRHAHHANEEAIYVLSGSGEARIGEARVAVRPGDWITARDPAGMRRQNSIGALVHQAPPLHRWCKRRRSQLCCFARRRDSNRSLPRFHRESPRRRVVSRYRLIRALGSRRETGISKNGSSKLQNAVFERKPSYRDR
jgi:mannose-6-phosphate isomerase-like protein (cupin superfamily)